jgi:hypothetical protein
MCGVLWYVGKGMARSFRGGFGYDGSGLGGIF